MGRVIGRRPLILVGRGGGPPPAGLDALVVEDDRELILGAAPTVSDPGESLDGLVRAVTESRPGRTPGEVVLRGGAPLRLHAVVHDLERDPSWRREWVAAAWVAALGAAERRACRSLATPLLGRVHGRLPERESLGALAEALERCDPRGLERLWLLTHPRHDPERTFALLSAAGYRLLQVWERPPPGTGHAA